MPDYSYTGPVAPNYNYNVPDIPTYDPYAYDPTLGHGQYASPNLASNSAIGTSSPGNISPSTGGTSASTPKATTPKSPNSGTGSDLQYPSGNPLDSGVVRGRQIQMPQFIAAHAADGGLMEPVGGIGYNEPSQQPKFMSQGGLQNLYVGGQGDGTSDEVPAMLSNGEFVIPADVVSGLGNGSNEAGAKRLDQFLKTVRQDKQSPDGELPQDAKSPLEYLQQAKEA